jgi:heat shock protein HtpX
MNLVRLFIVAALPSAVLISGGFAIGNEAALFGCLVALVLLASMYWLSDKVVLKSCRAELLTPYHSPTLFRLVSELSEKLRIAPPKIYAMPGETPNALSTGRSRRRSAIVFTEGILRSLSENELRGIICHELIHIKRYEMLLHSIAAMMAGLLGIGLTSSAAEMSVDESESRLHKMRKVAQSGYRYMMAPFPAMMLQSLVNRKREFVADEEGAKLSGNPDALANAIRVMEKKKFQSPIHVNPVIAHLFIVSPLTVGRIARLFNTHPPMDQRIDRLEKMVRHMRVASAHASISESLTQR